MSDFTPGPWRYESDTFDAEEGPVWVIEDVAGTNIIIAKLFAGGAEVDSLGVTDAEQEANANLIAAAPELAAALADVIHWAQEFMGDYSAGAPRELADACNVGHKILARIEGES